ncbi:MAG TPA: IclR family transcriptional regulator [Myxococcota bacterium]|nr:IclR family transcriptional regulator [Myxococcota bacterium]
MYRAPIIAKAFRVLDLVSHHQRGLSISDLSRDLEISKSTVHGITAALLDAGALARDGRTKRYKLGMTLFELGRAVSPAVDLAEAARPIMQRLMEESRESVFLGVRTGEHVSIIAVTEPAHELKISAPPGTRIPLLAGATGKALLAALPEDEVESLLEAPGLARYTARSMIDPARYKDELREVRRRGYALDDEEYLPGVRAVAAAIDSGGGRLWGGRLAAVWVVGFTTSIGDERMTNLAAETKSAAERIGRRMNFNG